MKCPICKTSDLKVLGILSKSDKQVAECAECDGVFILKIPRAESTTLDASKREK
jgi:transcriptional regulator NrdR family protein